MTFERWDVIVVPYPFIEVLATKRRPAVVLTTEAFHRRHGWCTAAMITTARAMQDLRENDVVIGDQEATGLTRPCVVRLSRIATLDLSEGLSVIGKIRKKARREVSKALGDILPFSA